ncbi:MT-A70 family methyltransferase [Brevibacterium sp.]|uniref:MT-A70 family methyltransferase n=1 Tax=Brevibacterium sp. TaxID=1701 RepID=UPI0028117A0F|nr:MT-A70 family methyltransferase [Brevibacterium sp.]
MNSTSPASTAARTAPHRPPTPQPGTYKVLLADPPWSPEQHGKLGAESHYQLMSNQRILDMGKAIREISAENSFCFLWVTTATVELGFDVLRAWGFEYKSFYVWIKPRMSLGNTFRNAGELLLLGTRGKGTKVSFKGQPNWGMHPLQEHSHKPEEVHQIIERLVGSDGNFLELFARRPAPTAKHWDVWGDELEHPDISLAKWGYRSPADHRPPQSPPEEPGITAAEVRQ